VLDHVNHCAAPLDKSPRDPGRVNIHDGCDEKSKMILSHCRRIEYIPTTLSLNPFRLPISVVAEGEAGLRRCRLPSALIMAAPRVCNQHSRPAKSFMKFMRADNHCGVWTH